MSISCFKDGQTSNWLLPNVAGVRNWVCYNVCACTLLKKKSKLCHNNVISWTFLYFIQCVCLCVCVFRMPLRPWRMRQPSRQWRRVSERILSGGVLRGQLRQDGHTLQLWRTARTLSHPRVLHVQRTAYHVRCQSTRCSPKNVKIKSACLQTTMSENCVMHKTLCMTMNFSQGMISNGL